MTGRVVLLSAVFVSNQDEALDFYLNKLGLEKVRDEGDGATRWVEVAPEGGNPVIALVKVGDGGHLQERIGGDTGVVFLTDNIQERYDGLREQGVDFEWEPVSSPWDGRNAQFLDQDNNKLLLVQEGFAENFKKPWIEPEPTG